MMTRTVNLFLSLFFSFLLVVKADNIGIPSDVKQIAILAGPKSHAPTEHEYLKSARLIKMMLEQSSLKGSVKVDIYETGWPEDVSNLDKADVIVVISDGRDGDKFSPVPFATEDRMPIMKQQMDRGCGYVAIHFSTFSNDKLGEQVLAWGGGYFDWQDDQEKRNWYSSIKTTESEVKVEIMPHPISNGLDDINLRDEYYYNIRFNPHDRDVIPIAEVPALGSEQPMGNVVAWAVERSKGNRGFCTTMGHFYDNWKNTSFRKLMLNGIIWAAGVEVPKEGVEAQFYTDRQVTDFLFSASLKGLILTGNHHPAHAWKEISAELKEILEADERVHVDISMDIEDLSQYDLRDYDFLLMNYCNWEDATGLSDASKKAFSHYVNEGGGLMIIHFANGAFHASLPKAEASDWPEYRKICRRVWDHKAGSAHDTYGSFSVSVANPSHELTSGLSDFDTIDELYYGQVGEAPIDPLLTAKSKDTGNDEPLAWTYLYGKGKVFQTVLGHDLASFRAEEFRELIRRAGVFVSRSNN